MKGGYILAMGMTVKQKQLLDSLNSDEKTIVAGIFKELTEQGSSNILDTIMYSDFEEIPVDITTFLHNPKFLGKGLTDEEGRFTVFPFWESKLKEIFPNNLDTNINTLILTGAIGIGKSLTAVICILYLLHRMLCLKDPYVYYGLQPIDKITFSLTNITKEAAEGVAWDKMQQLLQTSEWFLSRGKLKGREKVVWTPPKGIELIYGSREGHVRGRAIFCNFSDEISFIENQDVEKQKEKALNLITKIDARMQSRYMKGSYLPTLNIIASSKRTEQSFLESYIQMKKENNSKSCLIVDEPQWIVRTDKDTPIKFPVAIGNKYLNNEVLDVNCTEEELQKYVDRGYTILMVPIGYLEAFKDDVDVALTDIAGISTTNSSRYISGQRWAEIKNENSINLFTKEIIEVGNAPDDHTEYYDFINQKLIKDEMLLKPLYIHLDMSVTGDKTGLVGIWIWDKKVAKENLPESSSLYFKCAFATSIKAPKGYMISFEKNRNFIYWLSEQGFNIAGISTDSYQSYDTGQALAAKGYNYKQISVDEVKKENNKAICKPYQYLRSTIYEKRLEIFPTKLLTSEIIGLSRNNNTGKIDHDSSGINSKDQADALCGSIFNASQEAEKYEYENGETMDSIIETNLSADLNKTQVVINLEEELSKLNEAFINSGLTTKNLNSNDDEETSEDDYNDNNFYSGDDIFIW